MMPADAEFAFIEHAKRLDLYGVELFECRVRDQRSEFVDPRPKIKLLSRPTSEIRDQFAILRPATLPSIVLLR